jgi:hypothetical protein
MEANELRIGNFIQYDGLQRPSKVSIIDTTVTSTRTKAKPIPLTEEWLLNFGFEKDERNEYWFWKNCISVSVLGYIELLSFNKQSFKTNLKLDYVHQLQNLYFALIGEELTIKN